MRAITAVLTMFPLVLLPCTSDLPGATTRYSSGGYWRLAQALTALWGGDLKDVLDERLFRHLGIPADRWEWTPGKEVHDTRDFYPAFPNYGEYVDPPYEDQIGETAVVARSSDRATSPKLDQ